MSYKHEWINDDARYVTYNENGSVVESENDPISSAFPTGKVWYLEKVQHQEERTIFNRYSDKQMELEAQGWTIGSWDTEPVEGGIMVEQIIIKPNGELHYPKSEISAFLRWNHAIAYRLSSADSYRDKYKSPVLDFAEKILHGEPKHRDWLINAAIAYNKGLPMPEVDSSVTPDGYVDPVAEIQQPLMQEKLNEFTKSKWKAGELPSTGTVCEVNGDNGWEVVTICGHSLNGKKAFYNNSSGAIGWATATHYRAIQTDKERVIAFASDGMDSSYKWLYESLYDRGMLSMPDKGEE